jgi:hypothetical protein
MNRWWVLLPVLGGTVWLSVFADAPASAPSVVSATVRDQRAPEAAARPVEATSAMASSSPSTPRHLMNRETLYAADAGPRAIRDVFEKRDWAPPAVKRPPAQAAPEEVPAFPYAYAGRKLEGDRTEAYLTRDDYAHLVRAGDTLDGVYRIESISATQLVVIHLPTRHTHSIRIGDAE